MAFGLSGQKIPTNAASRSLLCFHQLCDGHLYSHKQKVNVLGGGRISFVCVCDIVATIGNLLTSVCYATKHSC